MGFGATVKKERKAFLLILGSNIKSMKKIYRYPTFLLKKNVYMRHE
jgi:hypothetical protein